MSCVLDGLGWTIRVLLLDFFTSYFVWACDSRYRCTMHTYTLLPLTQQCFWFLYHFVN